MSVSGPDGLGRGGIDPDGVERGGTESRGAKAGDQVTLTEIFRDTNVVKVQFLASALDDAGVPFTLHETWTENVELGGQEMRLLVRERDVDLAREVILEGVAELPRLQADLHEEFGDDEEPETERGLRSVVVSNTFLLIAVTGLVMLGLSYLLFDWP